MNDTDRILKAIDLSAELGLAPPELRKDRKFHSVQFNLDPADAKKVAAVEIDPDDLAEKGRDKNSHVTILFGLDKKTTFEEVKVAAGDAGPIVVEVKGLITFPEGEDGVPLVLEIESDALGRLHDRLATLDHTNTYATYRPHICVGYLKPGAEEKYADRKTDLDGKTLTLSDLVFSSASRDQVPLR